MIGIEIAKNDNKEYNSYLLNIYDLLSGKRIKTITGFTINIIEIDKINANQFISNSLKMSIENIY